MRVRCTVVLICTTLILAAVGLGFSIIYSDYLYSPAQGLASFQVSDRSLMYVHPEELSQAESTATSNDVMSGYIREWAKASHAMVFKKDGFVIGCGYVDYSGWLKSALGISDYQNDNDVFVSDDESFLSVYTQDDILFPSRAELRIKEIYKSEDVPEILDGVGFLYPLSYSTSAEGVYFTDATQIDELISLFENHGYEVMTVRNPQGTTLSELIQTLIKDGFLSRAVTLTLCGLLFCFVYMFLILYQENEKRLWICHIFGLSYKDILLGAICLSAGIALVAALLYGAVLSTGLTYIEKRILLNLFLSITLIFVLISISVGTVGYVRLLRNLKARGT